MTEQQLRERALKRVELVAWSGSLECLAFRLGIPTDVLLTALGRVQDTRRSPIKIDISLANSTPVWSAARRRLAAAVATGDEKPDLSEHPLHV